MSTLSTIRVGAPIIQTDWCAVDSGNTTASQFMNVQASTLANQSSTNEIIGQTTVGVNCHILRLSGAFMVAGSQQATLTARINGVSQSLTATVGTGTTVVNTDLTTSIGALIADLVSILFVTSVADATSTRPRARLIAEVDDSF